MSEIWDITRHSIVTARLSGELGPRQWKDGDERVHCSGCPGCGGFFRTDDLWAHRVVCWATTAHSDLTDALAEIERLRGWR